MNLQALGLTAVLCKLFSLTSILILLISFATPAALAGRYVFNQTPQTIEKYFGRYITKLTTGKEITYTYAPQDFRKLFPKYPKSNFSLTFVNNKVKYITLNFNQSFSPNFLDYNYSQAEARKFYNYIFGYQPPLWQELSAKFGGNETVYLYEYCLGDGVATSFMRYGYKQWTDSATLSYDARCEPNFHR